MIPNKLQIHRKFEDISTASDLVPGHLFKTGKVGHLYLCIVNDRRVSRKAIDLEKFDICYFPPEYDVTILNAKLEVGG